MAPQVMAALWGNRMVWFLAQAGNGGDSPMRANEWDSARRNWPATLMFVLTAAAAVSVVPWYGFSRGYSGAAWLWFALFLIANELSITCGYHRLFAHATYQAHPALKLGYLLFGAMALQNSALLWSAGHRAHHRYVDDPE